MCLPPAMKKITKERFCFLCSWFLICSAPPVRAASLGGRVMYSDHSPVPAAVVYALDARHVLHIQNNTIMTAENIPRALTNAQGNFLIENGRGTEGCLLARDLEDRCGIWECSASKPSIQILIPPPAKLTGRLFQGSQPIPGQEISAHLVTEKPGLDYSRTTITDPTGFFVLNNLLPGIYLVQIRQEVPQVGCCFRWVVTKQARVELAPGASHTMQWGGTNLPFLVGKITDTEGHPLHGVWVRLEPNQFDSEFSARDGGSEEWVGSAVTDQEGDYAIYDIPPGHYSLYCFRRLAQNNARRTLQKKEEIIIPVVASPEQKEEVKNICDIRIDLEPFGPLGFGQIAPALKARSLSGQTFDLEKERGKVVILHFYASWCSFCRSSIGYLDEISERFPSAKVVIVSINLDHSVDDCRKFVQEKNLRHLQLYDGPWADSQTVQDFHISDIPTTIILDPMGRISQIDLFGEVLARYVEEVLK